MLSHFTIISSVVCEVFHRLMEIKTGVLEVLFIFLIISFYKYLQRSLCGSSVLREAVSYVGKDSKETVLLWLGLRACCFSLGSWACLCPLTAPGQESWWQWSHGAALASNLGLEQLTRKVKGWKRPEGEMFRVQQEAGKMEPQVE